MAYARPGASSDTHIEADIQRQLDLAAQKGDEKAIRQLVARGGDVDAPNTEFHRSPLHLACARAAFRPDLGYLRALLAATRDINHRASRGFSALHHAVNSASAVPVAQAKPALDAIAMLLAHGSDVHVQDLAGRTPLHIAASIGFAAAVQELIAAGARVNELDSQKMTPLAVAASSDSPETIRALIKAGADLQHNAPGNRTPLARAASHLKGRAVLCLIENGLDPNSYLPDGRPILHMIASTFGMHQLTTRLVDLGASVTLRNQQGGTVLHLDFRNISLVRYLCKNGADVNAVDGMGRTPLYGAVSKMYSQDVIEALLEEGADPRIPAKDGSSAQSLARGSRTWQLLQPYCEMQKLL